MHKNDRLLDTHPHLKDFRSFLKSLNNEIERGAVLICASYLEGQLKEIISAFLCESTCPKKM